MVDLIKRSCGYCDTAVIAFAAVFIFYSLLSNVPYLKGSPYLTFISEASRNLPFPTNTKPKPSLRTQRNVSQSAAFANTCVFLNAIFSVFAHLKY